MIEIVRTGVCEDCKHAVLKLESYVEESFTDQETIYNLKCIHEDVCSEWKQKLYRAQTERM